MYIDTVEANTMMRCPLCGHAAHTRSSNEVTATTKERYNQCTNVNCSHVFITMETFVRSIVKPGQVDPAPPHPSKSGQTALRF